MGTSAHPEIAIDAVRVTNDRVLLNDASER